MIYRKRNESDLQINVAEWLRRQYPNALWTISPSGMKLGKRVSIRFKAMGYRKGTPDIMLFEARGGWHGMTLEIKMPGGKVSPEQVAFQEAAMKRGYRSIICPIDFKTENECFNYCVCAIKEYMDQKKGEE